MFRSMYDVRKYVNARIYMSFLLPVLRAKKPRHAHKSPFHYMFFKKKHNVLIHVSLIGPVWYPRGHVLEHNKLSPPSS